MNNLLFMVLYVHHNAETGGSAYKVDFASDNLEAAKKKYHALLTNYCDNKTFDFYSVMIVDSVGNVLENEHYSKPVEPEPVEPTE